MKLLLAAALSAFALSPIAVAGAASAQDVRLYYGDLDLSTPSGARAFDYRIIGVAQTMCRSHDGLDFALCAREIRAEVMSKLTLKAQNDLARSRRQNDEVRTVVIAD